MSWLANIEGKPDPNFRDDGPKVADPSIPNRMVSTKSANKPFLAYKQYREQQQQAHDAWVERKKARDAKLARGEKVGPAERDPTAERDVGLGELLRFVLYVSVFVLLAGKLVTGDFLWGYEGKWAHLKTYWPTDQTLFSERQLASFDGSDPHRPLYIAIDGTCMTFRATGVYTGLAALTQHLAGKDAARAYGTGCFATHQTHDLRGLSESELRGVRHWKKFFEDHKTYHKVGRVSHPPINPATPIPEHCNPKKATAENAGPMKKTSEFGGPQDAQAVPPPKAHEEL